MPISVYIPSAHKKYDLLPYQREIGMEVFEYPSNLQAIVDDMINEENGIEGIASPLFPYGFDNYDDFYSLLDRFIEDHSGDPEKQEILTRYKRAMLELNTKENWSVLRYTGPENDSFGLFPGRCYYWPARAGEKEYRGVIGKEFTSYLYPTDSRYWEILEDPTGMAYSVIFGDATGMTISEYDNVMRQLDALSSGGKN